MRRALVVGPLPPPINGMSIAFQMLVDGLRERGWTVTTADIADTSGRRGSAFSVRRAIGVVQPLATVWAKTGTHDVIYLTLTQSRLGFLKDVIALAPARFRGVPVVVHLHGGNFAKFYAAQPRPMQALVRATLARVDRIIVLHEAMREDFAMVDGWRAKTVAVANATPLPRQRPKSASADARRLLYLSSLTLEKGYLDVLEAAAQLGKRHPEWTVELDFAGDFRLSIDDYPSVDAMRADFEERVRGMPGNVRVTWHGVVDGERKLSLLERADVLVLPTYYVNEGQPVCILEALASALPVIATDYRAIRSTLPESFARLLVPPRAPGEIASRLEELFTEPGLYERLSADAVAASLRFTPEVHMDAIEQVLNDAIAGLGQGLRLGGA